MSVECLIMMDVDVLHVQEIAENIYTGANFKTDHEKGFLAKDWFAKKVCVAIKSDLQEKYPDKLLHFPFEPNFQRSVKSMLKARPLAQLKPIKVTFEEKPRAAKGQKRPIVESSSEEDEASASTSDQVESPVPASSQESSRVTRSTAPLL